MIQTLIINATIITMDSERRVLQKGAIAIDGQYIVDLGSSDEMHTKYLNPKNVIDAQGKLVMPGLINSHTHVAMGLFRGLYSGDPKSIYKVMFPIEQCLKAEDCYLLGMAGIMECIRGGATCIVDHYYFMENIAQAVDKIGIRGVLGHTVADRLAPFLGSTEFDQAINFIDNWKNHPRITPILAPHSPETTSLDTLRKMKRLSDHKNILMHIHLSQSPQEKRYINREHKCSSTEYLHANGILGENVIAAHCVFVDKKDIKILSQSHTNVVFCPTSQAGYLYNKITPAPEMIEADVNVVIGTDAAASTGHMSMLQELKISSISQLIRLGKKGYISPQRIVEMATINAAKALGLEKEIGSIEKGKKGDLLIINTENVELSPIYDPYSIIVHGVTNPHLDKVIVDGNIIFNNGEIIGVDDKSIIDKIGIIRDRILNLVESRNPGMTKFLASINK